MKRRLLIFITVCALIVHTLNAQTFAEKQKIVASDRDTSAYFGTSVSIYGNYAIVGAPSEDFDSIGNNELTTAGAIYVFERDIYGNWNWVKKITAYDRALGDNFGRYVSVYKNQVVVGAMYEDEDSLSGATEANAGSAYIYHRDKSGRWTWKQKITPPDRDINDLFGCSVSMDENYMVIGASNDEHDTAHMNAITNAGATYIYKKSGNSWNYFQKIIAWDRAIGDLFGSSVDICDNYLICGAPDEDEDTTGSNTLNDAGSAYIFKIDTLTQKAVFVQKLMAYDREADDNFGYAVAISENYAIVGAPNERHDTAGTNPINFAGSAYIFKRNPNNGKWSFLKKIVPSNRTEVSLFGKSISIEENKAIIGAPENASGGAAYIYQGDVQDYFHERQIILPSNAVIINRFGHSVSLSGNDAIGGAIAEDNDEQGNDNIPDAGAAYIFNACNESGFYRPDNIIANGDFETCLLDPWTVRIENDACMADAFLVNGECKFVPFEARELAANPWDIQIKQEFTPAQIGLLEIDTLYSFSFYARAESDHRPCHVYLGQNEDPWIPLIDNIAYFDREMKEYNYEFHAQVFASMKVSFELGTDNAPVYIDSVYLRKQVWPVNPAGTDSYFNNQVSIYPLPANDYLNVNVETGISISIYNHSGQQILQRISTRSPEIIDVSFLPEGLYILKLTGKNLTIVKKLIIN